MRFFYVDDSGIRKYRPEAPYFVLGGFGIDSDSVPRLGEIVREVSNSYGMDLAYPSELKFQHVGVPYDKENKPQWMIRAGLDDPLKRRALIYSVLRKALSLESAEVICVGVHTAKLEGSKTAIDLALELLLERIQMNCQDHDTYGLVLMDEERKHDKQLRESLRDGSPFVRYNRLVDTIAFMPSEESPGIQVADLVAGGFSRHVNFKDPGYLRTFLRSTVGYPDQIIGRGLKLRNRSDCLTLPQGRLGGWSQADRRIHEYEFEAANAEQVQWNGNGRPTQVFARDSDSDI